MADRQRNPDPTNRRIIGRPVGDILPVDERSRVIHASVIPVPPDPVEGMAQDQADSTAFVAAHGLQVTDPDAGQTVFEVSPSDAVNGVTADGANILPNGDFESGSVGWFAAYTGSSAALDTTVAHSGTQSFKFNTGLTPTLMEGPNGYNNAGTRTPVVPGKAYRFTGWVRPSVANRRVGIQIAWYDSAGAFIPGTVTGTTEFVQPTANTWTRATGVFTPPPGAAGVELTVYIAALTGNLNASEVMWIDDVSIVPVGDTLLGRLMTSDTGERVEMYSGGYGKLHFFSGDPQELEEGHLDAAVSGDIAGNRWGEILLKPARFTAGVFNSAFTLRSPRTPTGQSQALLVAELVELGSASPANWVTLHGNVERLAQTGGALANITSAAPDNVWVQWGATFTIDPTTVPGEPFYLIGRLTGSVSYNVAAASASVFARVGISVDNGVNWNYGNSPKAQCGTAAGAALAMPYACETAFNVSSWTGHVLMRAEIMKQSGNANTAGGTSGYMTYSFMPRG